MRSKSPTPQKIFEPVKISQEVNEATNEKLVAMLSHKSYEFCMQQDFASDTLEVASDKLEQLILEGLNRIFAFNGITGVPQQKIYETVEQSFDDQTQYDMIKALSALRRIKLWEGVDAEDTKYVRWMTNRVKFASRFICMKLDFVTSQERLAQTN